MSPARKPIRLLLVDDHQVVRVGLRTVLHNNQGMTVIGEAGSNADAVRAIKRLKPDIVLTDVRLPDGSGVKPVVLFSPAIPQHTSSFSHPLRLMIPSWRLCEPAHTAMSSRLSTSAC